jgi:hypothetical protein
MEHIMSSTRFKRGNIPWNRVEIDGRRSKKAREWRDAVWERDGYACKTCGYSGDNMLIHAHHVKGWDEYPELRFETDNGLTLCHSCHAKIHGKQVCNLLKDGVSWIKGKKMSEEHRKKLSLAHKGKPLSDSHREALKGRTPWNKGMTGLSSPMKGKTHSTESRKKMSEAHKGKKLSEEHKNKLRGRPSPMKGKKHTEESRKKMSNKLKGRTPWNKGLKTGSLA